MQKILIGRALGLRSGASAARWTSARRCAATRARGVRDGASREPELERRRPAPGPTASRSRPSPADAPLDAFVAVRARHALQRLLAARAGAGARLAPPSLRRGGAGRSRRGRRLRRSACSPTRSAGSRRINLLAPPIWGVLAWNLVVYLGLLVLPLLAPGAAPARCARADRARPGRPHRAGAAACRGSPPAAAPRRCIASPRSGRRAAARLATLRARDAAARRRGGAGARPGRRPLPARPGARLPRRLGEHLPRRPTRARRASRRCWRRRRCCPASPCPTSRRSRRCAQAPARRPAARRRRPGSTCSR